MISEIIVKLVGIIVESNKSVSNIVLNVVFIVTIENVASYASETVVVDIILHAFIMTAVVTSLIVPSLLLYDDQLYTYC